MIELMIAPNTYLIYNEDWFKEDSLKPEPSRFIGKMRLAGRLGLIDDTALISFAHIVHPGKPSLHDTEEKFLRRKLMSCYIDQAVNSYIKRKGIMEERLHTLLTRLKEMHKWDA